MIICIKYCKINSAEPLVINKEKPTLVYNKILVWFFFYSGPGDGFFSSAFQSTLRGNQLYKSAVPAGL